MVLLGMVLLGMVPAVDTVAVSAAMSAGVARQQPPTNLAPARSHEAASPAGKPPS